MILCQKFPDSGDLQVHRGGPGHQDPASDLGQPLAGLQDCLVHIKLGGIDGKGLRQENPRGQFRRQGRRPGHEPVEGLAVHAHVDQLVPDVAETGRAVVVRQGHPGSDAEIDVARAAGRRGKPLEVGKAMDQVAGGLDLAAQEDPLVRDEDMVEQDMGALVHAERGVADIPGPHGHELGIGAGRVVDVNDPLGVAGDGKCHGVGLVVGTQGRGRHHEALVGQRGAGLLELGAVDDDPVGISFNDPQVEIRIGLAVGRQGTVALGVGDVPHDHQVLLLGLLHEGPETVVVLRLSTGFAVHVPGDGPKGVDHRARDAAPSEAAPRVAHQGALHLHPGQQILPGLDDVEEPADRPSREGALRHQQGMELGIPGRVGGQIEGLTEAMEGGLEDRMLPEALDTLAIDEHRRVHGLERLSIIGPAHHGAHPLPNSN